MLHRRAFLASASTAAVGLLGSRVAHARADALPVSGLRNPNLEPFDKLFTELLVDNDIPGAGVAVTRHGRLVYARGFGHADVNANKPVQPNSLFRLASVSKPITAVGVLQLVDAKRVKLDDPVLDYINLDPFLRLGVKPDRRWEKITILHCLHHTGGWDRDRPGGFDPIGVPRVIMRAMNLAHPPTPDDVVRFMMGQPLDFDPGARMAYSNLGYLILGRVIEEVTGEKYETWIRKGVLAPVRASRMTLARALPENRPAAEVTYYDSARRFGPCLYPPRTGRPTPLPDGAINIEGFEGHGGWISSAIDLVRFASAFDYGKKSPLLSAAAIKEMWSCPPGPAGFGWKNRPKPSYYGCGWLVRPVAEAGKANTWHQGWMSGASTLLVRRHDGLNWAVLFNTDANTTNEQPADLIDGPMHEAADAVKRWPDEDLFGLYQGL